jgi:hypothetical protein
MYIFTVFLVDVSVYLRHKNQSLNRIYKGNQNKASEAHERKKGTGSASEW